ncbi:MAG: hypothetical protein KIT83_08305 [Bryobacterales bacterium]|nr:hypothetical protein [Bryobacterales bacterium]
MRAALLLLLLTTSAWMQSDALPALGAPAVALALVGADGTPLKLATFTEGAPLLMVFVPGGDISEICAIAGRTAKIGAKERIARLLVLPPDAATPSNCGASNRVLLARWRGSGSPGLPVAMIIDDSLHVRLRQPQAAGEAGWAAMETAVVQWLQGRQTYEVNCGHCHGFDGAQASAPETKSLVGITRKYPDAKVLELGALFGGVDMTGWSDSKKKTLLAYLRGL